MLLGIRHRFKQPEKVAMAAWGNHINAGIISAIRAEDLAADGLLGLRLDSRVANVHFTHSRTKNSGDVQPDQITRKQFWEYLCTCFREAFPRAESETGSILEFGLVVKELHKDAPREEDRSEHHHGATHASRNYRWKVIRKIMYERYRIHLNAVAHETYTSMFSYLRSPTAKKKLHDIDPTPFFSPGHPQGDALCQLLKAGEKYKLVRAARAGKTTESSSSSSVPVRSQFGIAYNWVTEHNIRKRKSAAAQLEADAVAELAAGRPQLLDFCKKHRSCLQDQIEYIWSMASAGQRIDRLNKSRLDLLSHAAALALPQPRLAGHCKNGHANCQSIYEKIMTHQHIDSPTLRHDLFETLSIGRQKGNALMLIGGKNTGKTTVTQPMEDIFTCMKCPQSDSFCPLETIRGYELLLWHDFRFNPGHRSKEEQGLRLDIGTWNRLLEGLPTPIGVPKSDGSKVDFVYDEDAPLIATGPFQPTGYKNGVPNDMETDQITCRMKFHRFLYPAPEVVDHSFKACPLCWSRWLIRGELLWRQARGVPCDEFLSKARDALGDCLPAPDALTSALAGLRNPIGDSSDEEGEALLRELEAPVLPVTAAASSNASVAPAGLFDQLMSLVAWRKEGHLTEEQFEAAKTKLGL